MAWKRRPGTTVAHLFPTHCGSYRGGHGAGNSQALCPGSGIILIVEDDDAARKMRWQAGIMQNKTVLRRGAC